MMTTKALEGMTRFYLKELFYGIPEIPVEITSDLDSGIMGQFVLDEGDDYDRDNDELMNAPEYRSRYKPLWDGFGGVELQREYSYMDPLNHPKAYIQLNKKIIRDIRKTVAVLLHELLHYCYWYIGREYHDYSKDFHEKCLEMELPNNYTDYVWIDNEWRDSYDYTKIDKYLKMYSRHLDEELAA